ncbi:MAG: hypothetical protein HN919_05590 [Verrucomicrobia bacterium]|jgi:hypothetical protein|nr:hypothetical protein [Verrucomicrobiota bacterium]MBT7065752.1 hypothetical protein [Verrucomicrobiota bacterium]MBT7699048.1 hypothetical protein [Verrucomicrobiota bacterium]
MITKHSIRILVVLLFMAAWTRMAHADMKHRFGVGAHYWVTADDIEFDNIDEDGFAWLVSYQLRPVMLLKFEVALEMLPDNFGGATEQVFAPQAYAIVGGWIYAGLGIGALYSDGEFSDEPFYALRAGFDFPILPHIHVDINANYRFIEWDSIGSLDEDLDTDTITVGAAVRIQI